MPKEINWPNMYLVLLATVGGDEQQARESFIFLYDRDEELEGK